jgi:ABC-type glycerol-3-phosphate transport system substrate-binding protein
MRGSVAAVCALLLLAGCGLWDSASDTAGNTIFGAQMAAGSASYVDRCIDIMRKAYPDARFEVTSKRLGIGSNTALVDVQATRGDAPASAKTPRDVAVQCRIDNGVIVDFHWTASPL